MDNFITLVIIIITILSIVGNVKKKQRAKTNAPKSAGGWIDKLNTFLDEVQKKVEAPDEEGPGDASEWRRLMDGGTPSDSQDDTYSEEDEAPRPEPVKKPSTRLRSMPPKLPSKPPAKQPAAPQVSGDEFPQPGQASRARSDIALPANRDELRRAIVWAEIIGPPMALRAQSHERETG